MEFSVAEDGADDILKLEEKVLHAMSRMEKASKTSSRRENFTEISIQEIVDYLTKNCCCLDGDVESQVITALFSSVKNGIVCALDNGKYRLVGPHPKTMASNCMTRSIHGTKCSCLNLVSIMSKVSPNACCSLKMRKSKKAIQKVFKRKSTSKAQAKSKGTKKDKKRTQKGRRARCVQRIEKRLFDGTAAKQDVENKKKCEYCLRYHTKANNPDVCTNCYPGGGQHGVPTDKFSPREELA